MKSFINRCLLLALLFIVSLFTVSPLMVYAAPIHDAAKSGDLNKVKELVEQGADVNAKDEYGRTILKLIPVKGNVRLVKWLKAHGAK